jgi:hypothetical protein
MDGPRADPGNLKRGRRTRAKEAVAGALAGWWALSGRNVPFLEPIKNIGAPQDRRFSHSPDLSSPSSMSAWMCLSHL